jgi:integrase/recombinase XerD
VRAPGAGADIEDTIGLRDRAILETFYSTGMRRMELANLAVYNLDMERGTLVVRKGKWRKDRVIPIGERALAWIEKYLAESRPRLVVEPDPGTVFLTGMGQPLTPNRLTQMVGDYVRKAGIPKKGSCHLFRHTMATLMLEGGADVRYIQEMLGHAKLDTTQTYTQVSIRRLKQVHSGTHPGAKLQRWTKTLPPDETGSEAFSLAADPAKDKSDQ